MRRKMVSVESCQIGYVLANDVYNSSGVTLVGRNAIITEYIKNKLIELQIPTVCVFENVTHEPDYLVEQKYLENVSLIRDILNDLSAGKKIEYKKVIDLSESLYCNINIGYRTLKVLNQVKITDDYTYSHCINTAFYCMLIGKWLGFNENDIKKVIQCGILHDVGKSRLPTELLNKRGVLTREEFEIIKKHTILGYDILNDVEGLDLDIRRAVLLHHERIDRSGYPFNASPDCVGIFARIVAIADVFDAMTSDRIYKKRATPFEAFEMFMTVGIGMYDISIVNIFLKNIINYYIGLKVLLSNGEQGEIVYIPPYDILSPVILSNGRYINLSDHCGLRIVSVEPKN